MSAKQTKGCPFPEEKLDFAEQKTEGSIFFTFMFNHSFTRLTLMPLGTSFVRSDKGCKTLFFIDTARHFQNIPAVRLQQQTTKRSGCTVHPRIRLIKLIPQMLTIAKGSAFQLKLFRLRLLFTQRGRFLFNAKPYLIVSRRSQRLL